MYKKIYYIVISLVIVVSILSTTTTQAIELDKEEIDIYAQLLTTTLDTYYDNNDNNTNTYFAMRNICSRLSDNNFELGTITITSHGEHIAQYNARGSIFVTILCISLLSDDDANNSTSNSYPLNSIIKTPTIWSLGIACKQNTNGTIHASSDTCAQWQREDNTDFPYIYYNLASYILNDISNLAIARVYGIINHHSSVSDLSNAVTINTFNTILSIPQKKNYPKTFDVIKQTISLAQSITKNTIIIDPTKTIPEIFPDLCSWNMFLYYEESLAEACSFLYGEIYSLAQYNGNSVDILYNEFFFYNLFNAIYTLYLDKFRDHSTQKTEAFATFNHNSAILIQQQRAMEQENTLQSALQDTIRQINNASSLYPIHIGLLMYQEGLLNLRDNLAHIYLPLHQLHYKLQNVQSVE